MSGQLEGDHGPSPTPLGSVLAAGSPSQTSPEPNAQYDTSMDQMVKDVISKTTAQVHPSTSTAPTMPPNHFNQFQSPLAPQSHSIPSWNPPETSARQMYYVMPPPQIPPSSSLPKSTSSIDPSNRLPQDILHIIQSDFTGDSTDAQAQKDQNISRVAEELRVKVRLSRYRRVRDQLSDSEDEVGESSGDDTVNNSEENTLDQDLDDNIDPPDDDEADLIDGSGDEEEEREKNNKALAKLRMEIEQIIGIPQDAVLSEEVDTTATELGEEQESTIAEAPDEQTAIQVTGETQENPQTKPSGEAKGTAKSRTIEQLSVTANELIANLESKLSPNVTDGGSNEEERQKHNEALTKLRMEVEQVTGISHGASLSRGVEETVMVLDEEKESTKAKEADLQNGIQVIGGIEENSPTKPPGEAKDAASSLTTEQMLVTAKDLLAKMNSINSHNKSQGISPIAAPQKLPATCPNEEPSANIQIATPTSPSATIMAVVKPDQPGSSTLANPQVTKPRKKPPPKKSMAKEVDSGDESEDAGQGTNVTLEGPTTANELKEPPPEITEVPFTRVSDEAIDSISPFGSITSLIGHVLVIQGMAGLGYDRVLDEGTVVCQKDGLVIGKIFETFGSVTNPHYSIRLPNHILTCKDRNNDEGLDLSAGSLLYYLPTHSNFVFTAELKAQPKGTDASNFFDEEPENADEIEFSDDEAEAAYRQACKFARKAARDSNGNPHRNQPRGHHSKQQQRNSVQVSENGRRMFVKMTPDHLNYGADDGDTEGRSGTVNSDYSILQRPGGPPESNDKSTPTSLKSANRQSSAQRSRGKKRGAVGRDRNSRRPPPRQSHPSTSQPGNGAAASSNHPTGNQSPGLQPRGTTNPGITNQSAFLNPESNDAQAQTNDQGSVMMAPAQMNMNLTGPMASTTHPQDMYSSSSYTSMWNTPNGVPPVQNQMMIPMMMSYASHAGIPSYNPHLPSAPAPSISSLNPVFQFGASQNFQDTNHFGYPNQLPSQQIPGYNLPSHPSFQFLQQQQMQSQHIQFQSQQTQNNQPPHHASSPDDPNLGHYNPWFYRPS